MEAGRYERTYRTGYKRPYRNDPAPRRALLSKRDFLTTTSVIATRGCHNRCGFCYLSTEGLHMPYRLRDVEQVVAEIQADGSFVLGFDYDDEGVFERTVDWIEANRLECATLHILTPYPGTPLFAQMDREGRILHKNWELYDTAHVVFRPARMSAEELAAGYAWCYERLFSHGSIWRRRPDDPRAVLPYLAMSYLYKRSNLFWRLLIRYRLTSAVWRPLVELTRRRHLGFRRRLAATDSGRGGTVVSAGV